MFSAAASRNIRVIFARCLAFMRNSSLDCSREVISVSPLIAVLAQSYSIPNDRRIRRRPWFSSHFCLLMVFVFSLSARQPSTAQQQVQAIEKDPGACQLAAAVITASGYTSPSLINTDEVGTFQVASTGESDPIHIVTSGTDKTRVEITTSSGRSIRILNGGRAKLRDTSGVVRSLSAANTFHERVSVNPAFSLLAECQSSNVEAIDAGMTTLGGNTVRQVDMALVTDSDSRFLADELKCSKVHFFIDPERSTVVEIDQDRFAENDSTVAFHYRVVYSDYRPEGTRLVPHTITTYVNSQLSHTIVVSGYSEPPQVDSQQLVLENLQ